MFCYGSIPGFLGFFLESWRICFTCSSAHRGMIFPPGQVFPGHRVVKDVLWALCTSPRQSSWGAAMAAWTHPAAMQTRTPAPGCLLGLLQEHLQSSALHWLLELFAEFTEPRPSKGIVLQPGVVIEPGENKGLCSQALAVFWRINMTRFLVCGSWVIMP